MAKSKNKKQTGTSDNKEEALTAAILSLEKDFGKGSVIRGDLTTFPEIGRISSGSISLNKALNGGYPRGRIIEIVAPESCGKTSLTLHAVAEEQKEGGTCAFVDSESSLDAHYAAALGVDIGKLLISQPSCGEEALNIVDRLARSGAVSLIILDSVAALVPQKELEGEIGDASIGLQARMMSQALRMLVGVVNKTNTTVIMTNQYRSKVGFFMGSPDVPAGGNSLKYYASQRLDIRRIETLKEGEDKVGIKTRIKVIKNKVGPPFRQTELNIMFGEGIDWAADLVETALKQGIVERSGAWFSYKGKKLGQGIVNACKTVREKGGLAEELKNLLLKPQQVVAVESSPQYEVQEESNKEEE